MRIPDRFRLKRQLLLSAALTLLAGVPPAMAEDATGFAPLGRLVFGTPVPAGTSVTTVTDDDIARAQAATLFRISPDAWPADVVLRFGTTLPTTSDESGLERDRTDFFALAGIRYRAGRFAFATEHGVGIHGTVLADYPQSDAWTYSAGVAYAAGPVTAVAGVVGQEDGLNGHVRGNEDLRELRLGVDVGSDRWLQVRFIRGLRDLSPAWGSRVGAGLLIR